MNHIKLFRRTAQIAHERKLHEQHAEIQKKLTRKPLTDTDAILTSQERITVVFPVSTVSMFRNYTFVGRDDILNGVHTVLCSPQSQSQSDDNARRKSSKHGCGPACCVLHGLGGIGKTQTALEFTYMYRGEYEAIFWVHSEQDSSLASSFALAADRLGLTANMDGHDGQNQKRAVERVCQWLRDTGNFRCGRR